MAIKGVLTQYAIKFPSALVGMFGVFGLLCAVGDNMANKILAFYGPALNWIARWLPIFYVPALVTLPLALQGIPGGLFLELPRECLGSCSVLLGSQLGCLVLIMHPSQGSTIVPNCCVLDCVQQHFGCFCSTLRSIHHIPQKAGFALAALPRTCACQ
jgi:hypothetical protein